MCTSDASQRYRSVDSVLKRVGYYIITPIPHTQLVVFILLTCVKINTHGYMRNMGINIYTQLRWMHLRRVFGRKRDEVTGEWRKLHNGELNDLYSLPNIVLVLKSRRMRWTGHVACMGEDRGVHRVLVGRPEGKNHLGDQDVDGRII